MAKKDEKKQMSDTMQRMDEVLDGLRMPHEYTHDHLFLREQQLFIAEFPEDGRAVKNDTYFIRQNGVLTQGADVPAAIIQCKTCGKFYIAPQTELPDVSCPFCKGSGKAYLTKNGRIPRWFGVMNDSIINAEVAVEHATKLDDDCEERVLKIIENLKGKPRYYTVSDEMISQVRALGEKYPNMSEVTEYVISYLELAQFRQTKAISFKPFLLAGGPGCGKTSYVKDLCFILMGKPARKVDLGNCVANFTFTGSDPQYSHSQPGIVIESMFADKEGHPLKNPVIHCDELDKLNKDEKYSSETVFYSILEPNTANQFYDNFLGVNVDASGINYIFTANSLERIPAPVLNRLQVFQIPDYTHGQLMNILDSFYQSWISINGIQEDFIPAVLSDFMKNAILERAHDDPRSINGAITSLFCETRHHDENEHHDIALFSPDELCKGWQKFRGKRKIAHTPWEPPEQFTNPEKFDPVSFIENYKGE